MTIKPWKKLADPEILFESPFGGRTIEKVDFQTASGQVHEYHILKQGRATSVLALTPDHQVVMIRQFRPGPNRILWDFPGGAVGPDEEPIEAARRELLEETGFSGDLHFAGSVWSDSCCTRQKFSFLATNCRQVSKPQSEEVEEDIEVILVPFSEAHQILRSGEFTAHEIFQAFEYIREHPEFLNQS